MEVKMNITRIVKIGLLSVMALGLSTLEAMERAKILVGHITADANQGSTQKINQQQQIPFIHPVWTVPNGQALGKREKLDQFKQICEKIGVSENPKIPLKTSDICRVATYNVHFWCNPYGSWAGINKNDFVRMVGVIKKINPDILTLQEVGGGAHDLGSEFINTFKALGYNYIVSSSISSKGPDTPGYLYNCILSKYPFEGTPDKKQYYTNPDLSVRSQNPEQRCFAHANIKLPNNKIVSVYSTHLEVRPIMGCDAMGNKKPFSPESARRAQLEELINYINENDTNKNIIIGADTNSIRSQDLQFKVGDKTLWQILKESWATIVPQMDSPYNLRHLLEQQPPCLALDYLKDNLWKDSFEMSSFQAPQFTTWSGTRIDFLFLRPSWNLPLCGSYVFYDWASDHIPVIMDINLTK